MQKVDFLPKINAEAVAEIIHEALHLLHLHEGYELLAVGHVLRVIVGLEQLVVSALFFYLRLDVLLDVGNFGVTPAHLLDKTEVSNILPRADIAGEDAFRRPPLLPGIKAFSL